MVKFKEFIGDFKQSYFINPQGKIISCGASSHISMIISYPEKFGLNKEYIDKIYNKYNEPIGIEGKAREEILMDLFKKGWIRIRRYVNNFWSINVIKLTKKNKDYIQEWASKILTGFMGYIEKDRYMPVKIQTSTSIIEYTVSQLSKDILYKNNESKEYNLIVCESIDDLEDYVI